MAYGFHLLSPPAKNILPKLKQVAFQRTYSESTQHMEEIPNQSFSPQTLWSLVEAKKPDLEMG